MDKPTKIFGPNLEEVLNSAGFYKQREWQGLTDEEVFAALVAVDGNTKRLAPGFVAFYCAIEAKLKEKNT